MIIQKQLEGEDVKKKDSKRKKSNVSDGKKKGFVYVKKQPVEGEELKKSDSTMQ